MEDRIYGGFFVRFIAFVVDSLFAACIVGIVKFPFSIAASGGASFLTANFIFRYSFIDVLGYVGAAAYFILLTYFTHSTPGKMLLRLEVVTGTGEWTFINILYRETVGRFLSSLLYIGYLVVAIQENKQGFHDMLCDTYVVYKNLRREPAVKAVPAGGAGILASEETTFRMPADGSTGIPENPRAEDMEMAIRAVDAGFPSAFRMEESHPVPAETGQKQTGDDELN
ncbi:MAG: RDD family protein [Bacteroidales bacterium]|nr:RDD family protein [Clostridium sp.]MCM1204391.1 RDD family protein [Bacteroidales bacterium]